MTKSDFIEQTTENMVAILEGKMEYNQLVIDLRKEHGEDTSGIYKAQTEFKTVITILKKWHGCLN